MITPTQYTRTYDQYREILRRDAEAISRSTDARAWLMKNIGIASDREALKVAVECIADITGDSTLRKKVKDYDDNLQ